jgi:hypothetical protein
MELCLLAASSKVIARDSRLHNTRLWGNSLSMHASTRKAIARIIGHYSVTGWPSFVASAACLSSPTVFSRRSQALPKLLADTFFFFVVFFFLFYKQCIGFLFFCIIESTEWNMSIISAFISMGWSRVIEVRQGLSEFWSTEEGICLDIEGAGEFGRDSLFNA